MKEGCAARRVRRALQVRAPMLAVAAATLVVPLIGACRSAPPGERGIVEIDADGDGRIDLWRTTGRDGMTEIRAPEPGSDPPRTVVLAIDAIPHALFAELQQEGHFRAFFPASRLVAPFPSLTNVGFTAILRAAPPLGYEDLYFDPDRDAFVGGAWERLTGEYKEIAPFHEAFDWEEPRLWGAFVFYLPERVREAELLRIQEILMDYARGARDPVGEDDAELLLYMGSTDALGHVGGRAALRRHLLRVEQVLERYLAAGGARDRIVLLSDHGMSEVPSRLFDLGAALQRAGFRLTDAIRDSSDVVAPAYGLVGSIQLYTAPGREEAVARAIVAQEGADFAVWRAGAPGTNDE
ncbi:MAG: alkaline phosphatase family protein, partial [Gemmatimonadota bacterium]